MNFLDTQPHVGFFALTHGLFGRWILFRTFPLEQCIHCPTLTGKSVLSGLVRQLLSLYTYLHDWVVFVLLTVCILYCSTSIKVTSPLVSLLVVEQTAEFTINALNEQARTPSIKWSQM